ncbi:ABC transporter ATP-binding protein [Galactobacter valiniphilus]|uniref:ABC transporter ATP-binding protein n=1 Tax=Galactobacter valiniphilus TaxID=2676122 RepID=A0A399JE35_9MICC|nr:ABC transporter ATP-binding protein [Galactobacter valiniphilus]RII43494.1 ABC transporter ATP-binding protein [Galactobacter valiniphilus]
MMRTRESATHGEVVLDIRDLKVAFAAGDTAKLAVKGLDLQVKAGEVVALVGESGSGKSVTSLSTMGLLPPNAMVSGSVEVTGHQVIGLPEERMRKLRATEIAMVFQEPMTALNPVLTVEQQLTEALETHNLAFGQAARDRAISLLERVGIPDAAKRIKQYPHQFSGGQRQRIVIAMALTCEPKVIIADEPTTALDVTVQADVLDLLRELKDDLGVGILLITHNMGVVADMADRVSVMFMGDLVEEGTVQDILYRPQHPYTQALLAAVPRLTDVALTHDDEAGRLEAERVAAAAAADREVVLSAKNIAIDYKVKSGVFRAAEGVSFDVAAGETTALVGESGSGKSTVAKAVLGLLPTAEGELRVQGRDLARLKGKEAKLARRAIGVVFQDPAASLDPRFPIGDCIMEPMVVHKVGSKADRVARAKELLAAVKLPADVLNRYPHELSGGQKQRVGIARALVLDPTVLIADEPTSALDVSVQATVLEMLKEIQADFGFACLFVSHDLAVVDHLADNVVVMKRGQVVEQGPTEQVLHFPQEDYTKELLAAAPVPDPDAQKVRREARHRLLGMGAS